MTLSVGDGRVASALPRKRLLQILDQVLRILQPDIEPDEQACRSPASGV